MHGYIIMRGIKHQLELTKKFMETTLMKWNTKEALSNLTLERDVQFSLRPIELYECVFPKEELPKFMKMLNMDQDDKYGSLSFKTQAKLMRKMLGLKEYPQVDYSKVKDAPFIPLKGVGIHPIGIKEDKDGMISGVIKAERL